MPDGKRARQVDHWHMYDAVSGFVSRATCGNGPKEDNGLVNEKKNAPVNN